MSSKKNPPLFAVTDWFGNFVELSVNTWNIHILTEHPQMVGLENEVQQTLQSPVQIQESTHYDTGVAFFSEAGVGSHAEGIRVIVDYTDTAYEKGASSGIVTTAYPIDVIKYGFPRLGRIIYRKGG